MYAIVYMFSHQFQVPFFITDYLSVLVPYIFTSFSNPEAQCPVKAFVLVPYIFTSFSNTSGYCNCRICVSVPHVFTSFSNMLLCAIPEPVVSVPYVFTSFSNRNIRSFRDCRFQYHTFLHHSQTDALARVGISKFQYHTFLHHSQTFWWNISFKHLVSVPYIFTSFSNHATITRCFSFVSVPYIFTSFSNTKTQEKPCRNVSVPYIFTSFSNQHTPMSKILTFQYHTFLHHSQTMVINARHNIEFQYHTFLHHSQTTPYDVCEVMCFSTIHFYIILKRNEQGTACRIVSVPYIFTSFSNWNHCKTWEIRVSVPYIFTSFSNCNSNAIAFPVVSVPYIFTSFSNLKFKNEPPSSAQNKVLKHI